MSTPLHPGFRFSGAARHRMSYGQVKRLAEAAGLPGDAMAQIAKGESSLYADVQQRDPGDSMVGYGLLQMTPNAWGPAGKAYMEKLGGISAMKDPVKNMMMARYLYKSAGNSLSPWHGTSFLRNRSGEGHLGPVNHRALSRYATDGGTSASPAGGQTAGTTTTTDPNTRILAILKGLSDASAKRWATPTTPTQNFGLAAYGQQTPSPLSSWQPNSALSNWQPTSAADILKSLGVSGDTQTTPTTPQSGGGRGGGGGGGGRTPSGKGTVVIDGKPVTAALAKVVRLARQNGWKGTVSSGIRTKSEQMVAARHYGLGHYPNGPLASNHVEGHAGALDINDPDGFEAALKRAKSRGYKGRLPFRGMPEDPVHFSWNGH